jgi:hypothetical protein
MNAACIWINTGTENCNGCGYGRDHMLARKTAAAAAATTAASTTDEFAFDAAAVVAEEAV